MPTLKEIVDNLQKNTDADAMFLTGSHGVGASKPYSDLDLVIILHENMQHIRSIYQWIDGMFADIFFFDRHDLKRIQSAKEISANSMDAIFISWLQKADILFDKTGTITAMKEDKTFEQRCVMSQNEQWDVWQKINYNLVANIRYFKSNDPLYHDALEIRLLHSVSELISGYFTLRGMAWRGEKHAVEYIKKSAPEFYRFFQQYLVANDLQSRFILYKKMAECVFPSGSLIWSQADVIAAPQLDGGDQKALLDYWRSLCS